MTGRKHYLSDKEIDAKIARLVRSPDASIAAKGIEIHQKRQAAVEAARPKDKKSADELVEEAVSGKYGLALVAAIWLDTVAEHGPRYNLDALGKTFRELAPNIRRDYPDIFAKMLGELDADCRASLEEMAAWRPVVVVGGKYKSAA